MHQSYRVRLLTSCERVFYVDANTSEEAESVAEQMLEDGDAGELIEERVDLSEARPVTQGDDGEFQDDREDY